MNQRGSQLADPFVVRGHLPYGRVPAFLMTVRSLPLAEDGVIPLPLDMSATPGSDLRKLLAKAERG